MNRKKDINQKSVLCLNSEQYRQFIFTKLRSVKVGM